MHLQSESRFVCFLYSWNELSDMRKHWRGRSVTWAGLLLLGLVGGLAWYLTGYRRPLNVLLVTFDTTRADHIGCYGFDKALTPTLDALDRDGVLFQNAFTTVPLTLPSHASILTGLYPPETGMHHNGKSALNPETATLAGVLAADGYDTGAFIASVVLHSRYGLNQGFSTYDDDMAGGEQYGHESHLMKNGRQVVNSALAWLNRRRSQPFFCWVHLYDPHAPFEGHPEVFGDRFRDDPYDGDIAYADQQTGRLIDFLKSKNLYEDTLVVIVGDHGEGFGEHLEEEHGFLLYNSTLRVPLIVSCPSRCLKNQRVPASVSIVDILPTVAELTQIPVPERLSGLSLAPALRGETIASRPCFSEAVAGYEAFGWAPLASVTLDRWKYVETTRPELYDLAADPAELNNLIATRPEQLQEMAAVLQTLRDNMVLMEASAVRISESDRMKLAAIGYLSGGTSPAASEPDEPLPDVKDMMRHYNTEVSARKLIAAGSVDEAIAQLRRVVEEAPRFVPARISLGTALEAKDQPQEAIAVYQAAIETDPNSANPHFDLAKLYARLGTIDKAIEHYTAALKLDPQFATAHFNLGAVLFSAGDVEQAKLHYEAGLREFPDSTVGQYNYGMILAKTGEADRAVGHLRRAAQLSPKNPQIVFQLGVVLFEQQKFSQAADEFAAVLRLNPQYPQAAEHLQLARRQRPSQP